MVGQSTGRDDADHDPDVGGDRRSTARSPLTSLRYPTLVARWTEIQ
jgi:hypothetical protein